MRLVPSLGLLALLCLPAAGTAAATASAPVREPPTLRWTDAHGSRVEQLSLRQMPQGPHENGQWRVAARLRGCGLLSAARRVVVVSAVDEKGRELVSAWVRLELAPTITVPSRRSSIATFAATLPDPGPFDHFEARLVTAR